MSQTVIQDSSSIRAGDSAKIELDAGAGFVDIGAVLGDVTLSTLGDPTQTKNTNVGPLDLVMRSQRAEVAFSSLEVNAVNWNRFLNGLTSLTTTAGTPVVAGSTQVVFTAFDKPVEFAVQNASGAKLTISAASGSVNGALVENTDYRQVILANGKVGVVLIDSVTVTTAAQTVTFTVDYTPAASTTMKFGDTVTKIPSMRMRVTFVDNSNSEKFEWTFKRVYNTAGLPFVLAGPETTEELKTDVTFTCEADPSEPSGEQVYAMVQSAL